MNTKLLFESFTNLQVTFKKVDHELTWLIWFIFLQSTTFLLIKVHFEICQQNKFG